ncbi:exosortase-associated protein EpsI, B-type [Ideonella margarita]|uniref:Exosortase-associated protein EpsI, B-type n=1 Tax=Ideonella margarita TaxID=2984191 RepID=A0ABU9C4Y6_9BURK
MNKPLDRRAALASLFMLAGAGAAYRLTPRTYLADTDGAFKLEATVPAAFGEWEVVRAAALVVNPQSQALLNRLYTDVLSRTYVSAQSGVQIMLSIAYGRDQSDATVLHRPEVCYPAQGFQILSNSRDNIADAGRQLPVRRLVSKLGARIEPITYWMVIGETVATTSKEQKLAQLRKGFEGVIPDGFLMRISSIGGDAGAAFRAHDTFIQDLHRALPSSMVSRMFGQPKPMGLAREVGGAGAEGRG